MAEQPTLSSPQQIARARQVEYRFKAMIVKELEVTVEDDNTPEGRRRAEEAALEECSLHGVWMEWAAKDI